MFLQQVAEKLEVDISTKDKKEKFVTALAITLATKK